MQQWARYAILGAMFVTAYLLILAWQKDYGQAAHPTQQPAAVVAQDQSKAHMVSEQPQAGLAATPATTVVSQKMITSSKEYFGKTYFFIFFIQIF